MPRIGSLFSGYGGLERGIQAAIGGEVAWNADIDAGACKILAHRYPGVPNLGDITAVDWSSVEPVEVMCGGFPCQPVSTAGKRRGDLDERWLWDDFAHAIRAVRPRLVVLENVRGLFTAGGGRLFGRVLGSLADLGYDAQWHGLRASDVGAPHGRFRVFIVATDAGRERHGQGEDGRSLGRVDGEDEGRARQRQRAREVAAHRGAAAATDAAVTDGRGPESDLLGAATRGAAELGERLGAATWGQYAPAVARWERVSGRVAPAPVGRRDGKPVLSPAFVEWMMGLPSGWVTDADIWAGLEPKAAADAQLKALGNGVVPQQATAALRLMHEGQAVAA